MRRIARWAAGAGLVAAVLFCHVGEGAASVGFYGTVGAGTASQGDDDFNGDFHRDTRHAGGGFVFDAWDPRRAFGYRLNLGYEQITHDAAEGLPGLVMRGMVFDQDFTVNVLPASPLRLWVGPELRLAVLRAHPDGWSGDRTFAALGIGPVVGFDYAVGPGLGLSWKLGYLFTAYAGTESTSNHNHRQDSFREGHASLTLAILFRTYGYQAPPPPPPPPPPPQSYPPPGYPPPGPYGYPPQR
jgi:hypothetical protein